MPGCGTIQAATSSPRTESGIPLAFTIVPDSIRAEVIVTWVERFDAEMTGVTRWTTDAADGYVARENLAHPLFTEIATDQQVQDCSTLARACALGARIIPAELRGELTAALRASDSVIRESLARFSDPGGTQPLRF